MIRLEFDIPDYMGGPAPAGLEALYGRISLDLANAHVRAVEDEAKASAPSRTGTLKNAIRAYFLDEGRGVLEATATHAKYLHHGTGVYGPRGRPILIEPKGKKALYWPGARHPVKSVTQRGIRPRDFLRLAVRQYFADLHARATQQLADLRALAASLAWAANQPSDDADATGMADPGGKQYIHPYPGETSFYPSEQNCGHYPRQGLSNIAYGICLHSGDNAWANAVRAGLKIDYLEKGSSSDWFLIDHPKWFILSAGYIIEQTIMGNMLELEKYIANTSQVKSDD